MVYFKRAEFWHRTGYSPSQRHLLVEIFIECSQPNRSVLSSNVLGGDIEASVTCFTTFQ